MKLWDKDGKMPAEVEAFLSGEDAFLDQKLVPFDCKASIAHAHMLKKIGVLSEKEGAQLVEGLQEIIKLHTEGKFHVKQADEDCHTAIEAYLIQKYGETGKKIHTARSRNDQVLTALRLYEKDAIHQVQALILTLKDCLLQLSKTYGYIEIPGYTHMQKAMPTIVKVWLGAFVSSFEDTLKVFHLADELVDQSPLGTGAGFGIPVFDIDREMTAKAMGFSSVLENPLYAQMSRGKIEATLMHALTQILFDLNKLSTDLLLFSMAEFGYVLLPSEFCTGSSIMPQKKNPDVLELVRASYHVVLGEEMKIKGIISNLMSGYNRDLQLTKGPMMQAIEITLGCLKSLCLLLPKITINEGTCKKAMSGELYATEEAYELVKKGIPFREAYHQVKEKCKQNKAS